MRNNLEKIVRGLLKSRIKNRTELINVKRKLSNGQKIPSPLNSDLIAVYRRLLKTKKIRRNIALEKLLTKREVRTLSGVAVITVLTKPFPCPGKCVYCPEEKGMPKSYLSNEPAAARAKGTKFDPYVQVKIRLDALKANGHATDKVELIVLGGTWSVYPKTYRQWFVKRCFDALNGKTAPTLARAQILNEQARHRCVGLTLETRPDHVSEIEVAELRRLGCTRVELGVQSVYDPVLKLNNRGQTVKQTALATRLLKVAGFKVTYHVMPNLPGSSLKKDLQMFNDLFSKPQFQPDMLKIYPCVVTENSVLYRWYRRGKFKPYSDKQLKDLLINIKLTLPRYVRVARLIRDIPADSIVAGNKITNLRQIIAAEMSEAGKFCKCIRCREAGHQVRNQKSEIRDPKQIRNYKFKIQKYRASEGTEYFLSYESPDRRVLYAFLRLRINDGPDKNFIPELKGTAIVRELHTYGELVPIGNRGRVQHSGLGKRLLVEAEKIAEKNRLKKIAVISGIGVREYYKKLGYRLEGTYMVKGLVKK